MNTMDRRAFLASSGALVVGFSWAGAAASAAAPTLPPAKTVDKTRTEAFVAIGALWLALRRATRLTADAPEFALDELMVRLRNRAFVTAYQFLGATALLVAVVLFLSGPSGITEPMATALAWALFGAAFGLPLVTTAIGIPDVDAEP